MQLALKVWRSTSLDPDDPMAKIERLTIALPADLATVVKHVAAGGDYASTSEVAREALRDWKLKRTLQLQVLAALKADIDKGLADLAEGRVKDFDAGRIIERGRKLLASRPLRLGRGGRGRPRRELGLACGRSVRGSGDAVRQGNRSCLRAGAILRRIVSQPGCQARGGRWAFATSRTCQIGNVQFNSKNYREAG